MFLFIFLIICLKPKKVVFSYTLLYYTYNLHKSTYIKLYIHLCIYMNLEYIKHSNYVRKKYAKWMVVFIYMLHLCQFPCMCSFCDSISLLSVLSVHELSGNVFFVCSFKINRGNVYLILPLPYIERRNKRK